MQVGCNKVKQCSVVGRRLLYANFNNYVHAFKGSLVKRTQWVKILFLFKKLVKYLYSTHTKKEDSKV